MHGNGSKEEVISGKTYSGGQWCGLNTGHPMSFNSKWSRNPPLWRMKYETNRGEQYGKNKQQS
jgi:hypothetical protein